MPLRVAWMAASPFSYYRGAADMMALDLAGTPPTATAQLCGDAHCMNFGFYGSPTGMVVFDVNDFDETATGPWVWDLKRLAVSLLLAGRANGTSKRACRDAVLTAVRTYRQVAASFETMSVLDVWRVVIDDHSPLVHQVGDNDPVFRRAFKQARQAQQRGHPPEAHGGPQTAPAASWSGHPCSPAWRLTLPTPSPKPSRPTPSRRSRTPGPSSAAITSSTWPRRWWAWAAWARRTSSSCSKVRGQRTRSSCRSSRPSPPTCASSWAANLLAHEGHRIVRGQRLLQAVSDQFLGWTTVRDVPFYVRQLKDLKGSMPLNTLAGRTLSDYGSLCAAILAKAHSRTSDPAVIAGYCGTGDSLDRAIAAFAAAYAGQVERDHKALVAAVKAGRLPSAEEAKTGSDAGLLDWPDLAPGGRS